MDYDVTGHYETMEQGVADFIRATGLSGESAERFANSRKVVPQRVLYY